MGVRKHWRAMVLVITGLLAGSFLGPRVVQAAGQLVTIVSPNNANMATVSAAHRLYVDTEASVATIDGRSHTFQASHLAADPVVIFGNGNSDAAFCAVMTGIVVDGTSTGGTVLAATEGTLVWKGTLPAGGGHLADTFGTGVFTGEMDVTAPNGVDWIIYGRQC